jgi:hypothetical protein
MVTSCSDHHLSLVVEDKLLTDFFPVRYDGLTSKLLCVILIFVTLRHLNEDFLNA